MGALSGTARVCAFQRDRTASSSWPVASKTFPAGRRGGVQPAHSECPSGPSSERSARVHVQQAELGVSELAHVTAKEHRVVGLEHGDGCLFQIVHGGVDILNRLATFDVAELVHCVETLSVSWVVDQREVGGSVELENVFVEALWSGLDGVVVAKGVLVLPDDLVVGLWRNTQGEGQDIVDIAQHGLLGTVDVGGLLAGAKFPQNQRKLTQLVLDKTVQSPGVNGRGRVREHGLWDQAVRVDKIDHHVPLTTVVLGQTHEELDQSRVDVLVGTVNDTVEEPVALFELVVEKQVVLRQLE
ncbi:hypothetical protein OGAPHI_005484 [Ogataea philodendri]|uniref:Uncharacterized protein n=1 Tax=Ogataea philodendri TaxID=1378263 RepID=A0A9P8T175_9ASCO|nr:uncharacterized protein OGAPHI_005484 [Ogataea philodendri]KAH3662236.1 hypothetical protein OGAPHI_005484 [Ogataea philodendri]